ncbi:hypothetical protein LSUE1_G001405 [Lachnellula suecica]|uniref:ZZ-type domain-containing protein n=1 Tax=Lachnellula suecica TaxID=602035 RepID=A0A8T9CH36_9HELO|nr:hypothetical protein LSUE1_G001405 [Lachnellula suecica]
MGDENIGKPYSCGSCTDIIPTQRARIQCHTCTDFHLCANCFVIKQFSKPHIDSHPTMVVKESGIIVPAAPGFSARPPPPLPPRQNQATDAIAAESEIPMANWGALWSLMKAPLERRKKQGSVDDSVKSTQVEPTDPPSPAPTASGGLAVNEDLPKPPQTPMSPFPLPPPKPVRRTTGMEPGEAPSYQQPSQWEPLFEADSTPTANFVALMSTIFNHLDPEQTGYLSPEIYSGFLEVQGYSLNSNISDSKGKRAIEKKGREHPEVGDLELGIYFSDLGISHTLASRQKLSTPEVEEPTAGEEKIKDSMKFGANMPMISRQGFIDLSATEYLIDPTKAHEHLGRAVSIYGTWKGLGPMPRDALPDSSIPKSLQTEKEVLEDQNIRDDKQAELQGSPVSEEPNNKVPMKLKGGEKKVEALVQKEEFVDVDFSEGKGKGGDEAESGKESRDSKKDKKVEKGPNKDDDQKEHQE